MRVPQEGEGGMSAVEAKVGDVVCRETGALGGPAWHSDAYTTEYDAKTGLRREIVWRECSGSFPRKLHHSYLRLVEIGEWK